MLETRYEAPRSVPEAVRLINADPDARIAEFTRVRRQWDPAGRLRSAQSVRLLGDQP